MWRVFLLSFRECSIYGRTLAPLAITLFATAFATQLHAAEGVLEPPQTFLVIADSTPLMVGDEQSGTVPLGTVVSATRAQDKWRYSPDHKGWVHLRDLLPITDAVETLTEEIKTKPTARAYQLRGIAQMTHRHWAKAAQDFEEAYDLGESAISLHLNLGTCYERLGQFPAAMSEYDSILKSFPDDPSALLARGNLLLQQGQFQAAYRDLTKATELSPRSAEAWNARGVAQRMLGRYEKAIQSYTRALELDKTAADALNNRGYARKQLGRQAEALQDYEAALVLAPESAPIRNDLAWFLATTSDASLQNGKRAIELSEAICKETKNENGEYLDTLAAAYACTGEFPAAVEAARLSLTVLGDHPGAARTRERLNLYLKKQPYVEVIEVVEDPELGSQPAAEASDTPAGKPSMEPSSPMEPPAAEKKEQPASQTPPESAPQAEAAGEK